MGHLRAPEDIKGATGVNSMYVLSIQYVILKAKVKLLVKETAISGEVLKTGENGQTEQVTQMHPTGQNKLCINSL